MRVYELLRGKGADVVTVHPDTTVADALLLLKERNLGAVVVSPDGSAVVGILSERDVVRRLAGGVGFLGRPVSEIMTVEVQTCEAHDSVESLMATMTKLRIRHLPVVDDHGSLAGIISIGDVVKSTITQLQFERDQLEGYVSR